MTVEIIISCAAVAGVIVTATGMIVTWRNNGKTQAGRDAALQANQEMIIKRLDDRNTGLTALNNKISDTSNHIKEEISKMAIHCAEVSTDLAARLLATERDIRDMKSGK